MEREKSRDCEKSRTESDNNKISEVLHAEQSFCLFIEGKEITIGHYKKKQGVTCFYCLGKSSLHFAISCFKHAQLGTLYLRKLERSPLWLVLNV